MSVGPATPPSPSRQLARSLYPATLAIWFFISVAMPATYYVLQRRALETSAADEARELSSMLGRVVIESPALWKYQTKRFESTVSDVVAHGPVAAVRVFDAEGVMLTEQTAAAPAGDRWSRHVSSGRVPFVFNNHRLGAVEVEVATGALVGVTLALAVISTLLGLGLALFVQRFPVRVVRRSEQADEARLLRMRRLAELSQVVASSLDVDRVLRLVVEATAELLGGDVVRLWVVDRDGETVHLGASAGDVGEDGVARTRLKVGQGIVGWVIQQRQLLYSPDVLAEPHLVNKDWVRAGGHRSQITMPLCVAERPVGALSVITRTPRAFSQEEVELLQIFAAKAATALDNARLYEDARSQRERLGTLLDVTQRLTRDLDQTEVLNAIAGAAAQVFGGEAGFRILEGDELVRMGATPGARVAMASDRLKMGESISGRVAASGQMQIVDNLAEAPELIEEHRARLTPTTGIGSLACVPLRAGPRVLGTLNVYRERGRAFDPASLELLQTFANQAAIALENARLHGAAVRRAGELDALLKASHAVRATDDLDAILDAILAQASAMAGTEHVKVYLLDRAEGILRVAAARGVPVPVGFSVPIGVSHTGIVAATGEPVYVADTQAHPNSVLRERDRAHGIRTYLGLPVKCGDEVVGVLTFNTKEPRAYTDAELALLGSFADQAAVAIKSARLHEALENRVGRLRTLARLNQLVSSALAPDAVLREITAAAVELMQAEVAGLWRYDRRDGSFDWLLFSDEAYAADFPIRHFAPGQGFVASIAADRRPLVINDVFSDARLAAGDWWRRHGLTSFMGLPVIVDGELEAVLMIDGKRPFSVNADDQQMLDTFAVQAATAIRNARLFADSERRRLAAEALAAIGRTLAQTRDPDAVGRGVVEAVTRLLGTAGATLFRVEPGSGDLVVVASLGVMAGMVPKGTTLPRGTWVSGRVALDGRPYITQNVLTDPRIRIPDEHRAFIEAQPPRSVLGVPLVVQGTVVGALSVASAASHRFTEDDLALAGTLADQAALALETARLYRQTEQALGDLQAAQEHLVRGETMRALGELASGAAHHLNNLLCIVVGRTQLMLGAGPAPAQRRPLEIVYRAARDGAEVVRRIQEFARRKQTTREETIDLAALARDVVEMTRARWRDAAQAQGVSIEVRAALEPVPPISGHPAALREVVTNLILNAVEALPAGGRIGIATRVEDGAVVLSVTDDGVGMSEEVLRRAQEPFFTTKGPKGMGLGLSVNYGIIQRHGGEQRIVSAPGAGTTVSIQLPVAAVPATPGPAPAASAASPASLRVLIVDDEPEVLSLVAEMVDLLDHEAVEAPGPDEALALLERGPLPDIVLSDHGMPGMTGTELAEMVRRRWPGVAVGIMTGWGDAVTAGPAVDFVLAKPLDMEDLGARLQAVHARAHQPLETT